MKFIFINFIFFLFVLISDCKVDNINSESFSLTNIKYYTYKSSILYNKLTKSTNYSNYKEFNYNFDKILIYKYPILVQYYIFNNNIILI